MFSTCQKLMHQAFIILVSFVYNVYNLTGYCSIYKRVRNSKWSKYLSGRSDNDIASAVVKIIKTVVKDIPYISKIILWSDGCVPQNKNSIMSLALLNFLKSEDCDNIKIIEQKFSGKDTVTYKRLMLTQCYRALN